MKAQRNASFRFSVAAAIAFLWAGTAMVPASAQGLLIGDAFCPEPQASDFTPLVNCEEPGVTVDADTDPFCGREINLSVPSHVVPIVPPFFDSWAKDAPSGKQQKKPYSSRQNSGCVVGKLYTVCKNPKRYPPRDYIKFGIDSLILQGQLLLEGHKYSRAQAFFRTAASIETDPSEHEYCLGYLALAKKNSLLAEEHFERWSSLKRVAPCALKAVAKSFEEQGYLEPGVRFLRKALACEDDRTVKDALKSEIATWEKNVAGCEGCGVNDRDYFGRISIDRLTRWKSKALPIKVFLVYDAATANSVDFRKVFVGALEQWLKALDGRLRYTIVDTPEEANISVRLDGTTIQGRIRGTTEFDSSESDWRQPTDFLRKGYITVYLRTESGGIHSQSMLTFVCLHEIGHALGITGHSTNGSDVMFYVNRTFSPRVTLSQRDKATIRKLYWDYPVKAPPVAHRAKLKLLRDVGLDAGRT